MPIPSREEIERLRASGVPDDQILKMVEQSYTQPISLGQPQLPQQQPVQAGPVIQQPEQLLPAQRPQAQVFRDMAAQGLDSGGRGGVSPTEGVIPTAPQAAVAPNVATDGTIPPTMAEMQQIDRDYGFPTSRTDVLDPSDIGGTPEEEIADAKKKGLDRDYMRGMALKQMGFGLGQMQESVGSSSGREYLGGWANYIGGYIGSTITEDQQDTVWGKVGPMLGIIGTALNMQGKQQDYKNDREYKNDLYNEIGRALGGGQ